MAKRIVNTADYTFNAAAKTITFSAAYTGLELQHIELVTNLVDNVVIYQFNKPTHGGSLAGLVLTLVYDTTAMSNGDALQIFVEADFLTDSTTLPLPTGAATAAKQDLLLAELQLKADVTETQPVSVAGSVAVTGALTDTQLRAVAVPVSGSFFQATQPVSIAAVVPVSDNGGSLTIDGTVAVSGSVAVTGTFFQATQPVSLASNTPTLQPSTNNIGDVDVLTLPSLPAGTNNIGDVDVLTLPNVTLNAETTKVIGTVNVAASQSIQANAGTNLNTSALALETTQSAINTKTPSLGQAVMASSVPVVLASNQSTIPVSFSAASVLFKGRAQTFRTPGRAGTTGQNIMSIHNATGSGINLVVKKISVDLYQTVIKAVTVAPPIVRMWKVTVLPTNGTTLAKTKIGGTTTSSASVTVLGDASADGTGSGTTLTSTRPAGTFISQEYAPRLITAAGYEVADRLEFFADTEIVLGALEGIVVFLDYVLATQNPVTDMWIAGVEWEERTP